MEGRTSQKASPYKSKKQIFKCDRVFISHHNKSQHIKQVHKKLKPYICLKCGKSFGQKGTLKIHNNNVHEKIRNYKCIQCDKAFGERSTLNTHIEGVHEKVKKYGCGIHIVDIVINLLQQNFR